MAYIYGWNSLKLTFWHSLVCTFVFLPQGCYRHVLLCLLRRPPGAAAHLTAGWGPPCPSGSLWSNLLSVFGWTWLRAVESTVCSAITAEGLAPSKHVCKHPAPVLYLSNMFPRWGRKGQTRLVTLERTVAVCVPRGLRLLLFFSSAPSHHRKHSKQFSKSQERSQSSQRAVYGLKTLGRRNNNKVNATSPFPCGYVIKGQTAVSGRAGRGLGTQLCTSSRPPCFGGWGREYPSSCQEALTRACLGLSLCPITGN